jgi:hypothetical protein
MQRRKDYKEIMTDSKEEMERMKFVASCRVLSSFYEYHHNLPSQTPPVAGARKKMAP